jgi:hypothetical protein
VSARYVRVMLANDDPLLMGQYPDRPAPAHVLNGFVAAGLGISSKDNAIRALLVPDADMPEGFEYLGKASWAEDQQALSRFRSDLSTIFNPDRRLWEKFGSPVPVHALLANADASDDGYGPLMWEIVRHQVDEAAYLENLRTLLEPAEVRDPVSALAQVLVKGAESVRKRSRDTAETVWFRAESGAGKQLATQLAEFIYRLSQPHPRLHRLLQIQHLARGVYLSAFLAIVLGPTASVAEDEPDDVFQLGGRLVTWGGTPPGSIDHPMIAASARSFQLLVNDKRHALQRMLKRAISAVDIPSKTPAGQRRLTTLRQLLIDGGEPPNRVPTALEYFRKQKVPLAQGAVDSDEWVRSILDTGYGPAAITKGLRTMGRKVGLVAPDRGAGAPRFVIETPLLGTLVAGLCGEESMSYESFVDRMREQLGLVLGPGTRDDLPDELGLWESPGIGRQLLRDSEDDLRTRLVRAGLAVEYSDGHTEVFIA